MSKLHKAIRCTRFQPKQKSQIKLSLESGTSFRMEYFVLDCSQSGLSAKSTAALPADEMPQVGDIVPHAKLTWDQHEFFLGRLAVRRVQTKPNGEIEVAFSTIDQKIPVQGILSHALKVDLDRPSNTGKEELTSDRFSLSHFVESEFSNVDLFDRVKAFDIFFSDWEKSKKYAYKTERLASKGPRVNLKRQRKNGRNDYIVMGSNDYLGLASHPEVVQAAQNAVATYGFSSTGSPVSTGLTDLHQELCYKIAHMHNKEAAILYNSGYTANVGIISCLTTSNDLVIADQLAHASIQDAMLMSKATSRFFKHNNVQHLETVMEREREKHNGCLVVTEGIFSMDGDVANLDDIYTVARKYNARILVDQAHCFGVLGANGLGVCEKYHLLKDIDLIMGTFSKICGGIGGFATGSKEVINWLHSFSRSQIFSVSLPPSTVAAVSKALDIFQKDKTLLHKLHENIRHFQRGLESIGYRFDGPHESAIVPVIIGDESKMAEMYQSLLDDGIWCIPVIYPAVSRNNCRFRFTIMATHSLSDIDYAVSCLEKAMLKVGFQFKDPQSSDSKAA